MWMLLRLVGALLGVLLRVFARVFPRSANFPKEHPEFHIRRISNKRKVRRIQLAYGVRSNVIFKITRENWADCFFFRMGLANEVQVGDAAFDRKFYIACDHPGFNRYLQSTARLREDISAIFRAGYSSIYCDGIRVWIDREGDRDPDSEDMEALRRVSAALLDGAVVSMQHVSRYELRVFAIETVIWSIAGYAVASACSAFAYRYETVYLDFAHLVEFGLVFSVALLLLLFLGCLVLLDGSSRVHRVIIESVLVLGLSAPIAGVSLLSDLNQQLDTGEQNTYSVIVAGKDTVEHRSRRSRHTEYRLHLDKERGPLPSLISVDRPVFRCAAVGVPVVVSLRKGLFNLAWLDSVRGDCKGAH